MLLQSLRALCLAPGGSGSVWKYLEALVRSPGVSGRIACGLRTELHFADGGRDRASLEAIIERVWRCTWRPSSSEIGGVLGGGQSGGGSLGGRRNGS